MQKNNPQLFLLYKFRIRTKECFKVLSKIFISLSSPQLSLNQTQQKLNKNLHFSKKSKQIHCREESGSLLFAANVRWSSHSNSFVHTRSIAATRRIMIRFCVFRWTRSWPRQWENEGIYSITTLRVCPPPAQQDALWFMAPGTWRLAKFSSPAERNFFYQNFSIKHIEPLRSWRIAFTAHFYDLCWKVESFIVCLPVWGYKSLVLGEEDLSGRELVPALSSLAQSRFRKNSNRNSA